MFTIIRPPWRQHVVAHALSVQENLIRPQCRCIEASALHRRLYVKRVPQSLHRVWNPWMPQRRVHRHRRLLPHHRVVPSHVVKFLPRPTDRGMRRRLPVRSAHTRGHRSVGVLHHQRGNHRRRIGRGHAVGIENIMHRLNRDRIQSCVQLAGHISTHILLPRHLLPCRQRIGC